MNDAGKRPGRVPGARQDGQDGLDSAARFVPAQALPRLSSARKYLGGVKLHAMGIFGIDVLRELVKLLGDPVRLRLEHRYPAEDEVLLAGVSRRPSIVEVEKVHGGF